MYLELEDISIFLLPSVYPNLFALDKDLKIQIPNIYFKERILLEKDGEIKEVLTFVEDTEKINYTVLEIEDFGFVCSC